MIIEHITQKDTNGCVVACIAMALNKTYEEVAFTCVRNMNHPGLNQKGLTTFETRLLLQLVAPDIPHMLSELMLPNRRYLVGVPSLNNVGGAHCVLVQVYDDTYELYDPAPLGLNCYDALPEAWFDAIEIYINNKE